MNITNLAARGELFLDTPRIDSTGTKRFTGFSMDALIERLTKADEVAPVKSRQISGDSSNVRQPDAAPRPFYMPNPNYVAGDPASETMVADATATATPQAVQWTSPNGLTTTGVMNPFGLTKNNPSIGFFGAPSAGGQSK